MTLNILSGKVYTHVFLLFYFYSHHSSGSHGLFTVVYILSQMNVGWSQVIHLNRNLSRDTVPAIAQNKRRKPWTDHRQVLKHWRLALGSGESVDTVERCCTLGSEGKRSEWNYSRCSDLLRGVCYRNGSCSGGEYWTLKKKIQQQRMFAVIPRPGSSALKWTDQMQTRLNFL